MTSKQSPTQKEFPFQRTQFRHTSHRELCRIVHDDPPPPYIDRWSSLQHIDVSRFYAQTCTNTRGSEIYAHNWNLQRTYAKITTAVYHPRNKMKSLLIARMYTSGGGYACMGGRRQSKRDRRGKRQGHSSTASSTASTEGIESPATILVCISGYQ